MQCKYIKVGTQPFYVKMATEPEAWIKGLGGIEKMRKDAGMLFLYKTVVPQTFWMKGMEFPIDLVMFDKEFKVIQKFEKCPPDDGNMKYSSGLQSIAGALELNYGMANKINKGDKLNILKDAYLEGMFSA